jgi:dimethylaniline monooxygenase (N-oxide forming)
MVSSKFLTIFSDFRIPAERTDVGDFLKLKQYAQYLEDYCDHFKLRPHIYLNTEVKNVRRGKGRIGHIVTYAPNGGPTEEWDCDAIVVCSGLHVNKVEPTLPGIENVRTVLHSSEYRNRDIFKEGDNVIVLGAGETAMDMAYFAVTSPTKSVTICTRNGFVLAPKVCKTAYPEQLPTLHSHTTPPSEPTPNPPCSPTKSPSFPARRILRRNGQTRAPPQRLSYRHKLELPLRHILRSP